MPCEKVTPTVNEPSRGAAQEGAREKDQKLPRKRRLSCGGNLVVAAENVQRHDQVPRVVQLSVRAAIIHQT
jgi:hypothetical protein